MDKQPTFGFNDLLTCLIGDMAKATSERKGDSPAQQFARSQAAIHMIMGFHPRDVAEVMLAGHCMMLHEVMTAEIHDVLFAEASTNKRTLPALNKAFNDNLDRLERYRQRHAEGQPDAPEEVPPMADGPAAPVEPAVRPVPPEMNRAARREATRLQMRAAAAASRAASRQPGPLPQGEIRTASPQRAHHPGGSVVYQPTDEAVAKCQANPVAMTALAAGDPVGFARAMGIEAPSEAFLAAAKSSGSPFDAQALGSWPRAQATGTRKG
jgi:hypothetical protein